MRTRGWKIRSAVWGLGAALALSLSGRPVSAQMDDLTMPGGEKAGTLVESKALLSESEFNEWAAKPGAVVFDLQYRGLTAKEVGLSGSSRGYRIHPVTKTPFTERVGLSEKKSGQFTLPLLHGSKEVVVEFEEKTLRTLYLGKKKFKALYLDLDGNGELGAGEKLEPVLSQGTDPFECFITPDFTLTLEDGRKAPFRWMFTQQELADQPTVIFSPFCIWEGTAKLAETEIVLRLYDGNLNGSFSDFKTDWLRLTKKSLGYHDQNNYLFGELSSLIRLEKEFYQLRLTGDGTVEKPLRAVLCKDTTPTGKIQIKLIRGGGAELLASDGEVVLISPETPSTIQLRLAVSQLEVPEGRYQIDDRYGSMRFGEKGIFAQVRKGPEFQVLGGQTATVEIGKPQLKLVATGGAGSTLDETQTSFPRKTGVYLDLRVIGMQGEEYRSISAYSEEEKSFVSPRKAHLQILGPDGRKVASTDLEYG